MAAPPRVNAREQAGDRAGAAGPRPFCSEYFVLPLPACRRKPPRPADPASAVKHSRGWPLSFPGSSTAGSSATWSATGTAWRGGTSRDRPVSLTSGQRRPCTGCDDGARGCCGPVIGGRHALDVCAALSARRSLLSSPPS